MPSKIIRSGGGDGGGNTGGGQVNVDVPTARWSDDVNVDDVFNSVLINSPENATVDDALKSIFLTNPENINVDDVWTVPLMQSAWAEDAQVNDLMKLRLVSVDVARSGTPDNDPMFDAWTDNLTTGVNHGNESLQAKGASSVPGADSKQGWLAIDLTPYAGWSAGGTGLTLNFQASNSNLVLAVVLTANFSYKATKPFTESTLTWATNPTGLTGLSSPTASIAAGGGVAAYSVTMAAAQLQTALGNWLVINFTTPGGALPDTVTILSRDNATAGNRPKYTIDYIQRGT